MEQTKKSGLGTAGLVLGIVALCTSIIPIVNNLSFIMGIIAFIFGLISAAKDPKKGKGIASIILAILAVVVTINSQKAVSDALDNAVTTFNTEMNEITGKSTDELLGNKVDVEIGDLQVTTSYGFSSSKLPVKVTNKTTENKSFSIQLEAVDSEGNRITNDYIYANSLGAGQSQKFDAFTLVSSDRVQQLRSATFKIVEISMY